MRNIWAYRRALLFGVLMITAFGLFAVSIVATAPPDGQSAGLRASGAVGALFLRVVGFTVHRPFCTAAVVASPRGDLLITAAHCLGIVPAGDIMFAPDFHNGTSPFGLWKVTGQAFLPGWFPGGNVNNDVAFLTVAGNVQAVAGAETIGYSSPVPASVRMEGYSLAGGTDVCIARPATIVVKGQRQLSMACPGFDNGSSGGPMLTNVNPDSGMGVVVGVIGGYQQGGSSPDVSYSSPFGPAVTGLAAAS
jgi:Trypsin